MGVRHLATCVTWRNMGAVESDDDNYSEQEVSRHWILCLTHKGLYLMQHSNTAKEVSCCNSYFKNDQSETQRGPAAFFKPHRLNWIRSTLNHYRKPLSILNFQLCCCDEIMLTPIYPWLETIQSVSNPMSQKRVNAALLLCKEFLWK